MTNNQEAIYFADDKGSNSLASASQGIPKELKSYLKSFGKHNIIWQITETVNAPGILLLRKLDQLRCNLLLVSPFNEESDAASRVKKNDPYGDKSGYYRIPALDIVLASSIYPPEGLLVWIPILNVFGTWDENHFELTVFPGHSWNDIVSSPGTFLESQWQSEDERPKCINAGSVHIFFDLWERCNFVENKS